MKAMIEMPDDLFKKAEAVAALQGLSLKDWLTQVLNREVGATSAPGNQTAGAADCSRELDRLAELVGRHWQGEQNASTAIREDRRS
ncbi:MAG TPA: hypothetical protein VMH83_06165 [Candidatus Acidoferrum sp.]|nr:hypothetical protein [Candidatus Acidoferrum sp.]